jgi:hypothetical protein
LQTLTLHVGASCGNPAETALRGNGEKTMRTGLSLSELAAKIEGNKALKQDFIADTKATTMQVQNDKTIVLELPQPGSAIANTFPVLKLAHDQIGARTGIPAKYYDRMLTEAPDLLATNVNAWFRKNPEKRMVRTLGGDARAFLSNRYNRIENEEIAEVVLPILADIPEVRILSSEITEKRMYIQALTPRVEGKVALNDVVQCGVVISNSETGHGAVSISPLVYRLRCLNGMIANDGRLRANHVGGRIEETEALYADDTRKADDRAILLKVRDHVRNAVDAVAFAKRVEAMSALTTAKVIGDPERVIEVLAKKVGATDGERTGILRSLIEGGDLTAWGLLNAVTAQAHTSKDYDRSVEFERMGGALLELPRSEWRSVLEAA